MIDFQNGGLESQVYKLILKMCDLTMSDEFPHFKTKRIKDDMWECSLEIPGVDVIANAKQKTEVAAINRCASNMLHILSCLDENGLYDPKKEESVFKDRIEERFGDISYDPKYFYYLCTEEIPINQQNKDIKKIVDSHTFDIECKTGDIVNKTNSQLVVDYLMKRKKKGWC